MTEPSFLPFWDFDCPYIQEVFEYTDSVVMFNGYFRLESKTLPVRRIMESGGKYYWIEILTKEEIEDTSEFWYDDDVGGNICLTPTAKIRITYTILKELVTKDDLFAACDEREKNKDPESERNQRFRQEKEEAEWKARMEHAKTIDYSAILKKLSSNKTE
jgi:hypothetical protein